ncbi:RNA polymerase sigma factor ShbA [Yimella sp. cx-573]|nr:RNA polymerase sigma factor ShbA [Yimella sp. cx-573]
MSSSDAQISLRDLAVQARSGDDAAAASLMAQVHQIALRYARARLGRFSASVDASADVAQEVCVAVLTALPRYVDKGAPFEAFVYRIASHKVADAQRGVMRGAVPSDDLPEELDTAPTPEQHALQSDAAQQMHGYLDQLSDQQREVLTLRVAVGMSAEETAAALDMTPGAVRVAQHRALARLRTLMSQQGGIS